MITATRACSILYSYLSCNCRSGASVVLPANVCSDVYFTFLKAGVEVTFADIEPENLGLDLVQVEDLLRSRDIQGMLYNHTYGNEFTPIQTLTELKRRYPDVKIIDDRCLCVPQLDPFELHLGLFDLVLFSTGYAKTVDLKYGGFGYIADGSSYDPLESRYSKASYDRLKEYFETAQSCDRHLCALGKGDWLEGGPIADDTDEYCAKVVRQLERVSIHKKCLNGIYGEGLDENLVLGNKYNHWRFQIVVDGKGELLESIFKAGLFASGHYEPFATRLKLGRYPVADNFHSRVVNLFNDFYFTAEMAEQIVSVVDDFSRK